ncbi:MAG: hypothetical protein LHV68_01875 [Elusimicrobia bacterium]|nr:hypothetical protein [Candidatus Liberimonas magnetica]
MARGLSAREYWFKEARMNIDLTPREIELLLILINEAAQGDFSLDGPPIYSIEELALIKKLEKALETMDKLDKKFPDQISESKH